MIKWTDYGESSLTLLAAHCGIIKADPRVPYDPSDFKRCIHLIECLRLEKGEITHLLKITAKQYPAWKPFAEHWDELTRIFEHERYNEGAPELYNLIQKIQRQNQ